MTRQILILVAVALSISACEQMSAPTSETEPVTTPTTEEEKTFYALGLAVGASLAQFELSEEEVALMQAGLVDSLTNQETEINVDEYRQKIMDLGRSRAEAGQARMAAEAKAAAAPYLAEMAAAPGAQSFKSGLVMFELSAGDGAQPAATDTVEVHYHGTLPDGTVFDSSVDRGTPATFPLNGVISCWTEAVQKIKVGGKSRLICPADIAYGDRGSPPKIMPGATLVFEVELLSIKTNEEG